MHRHRIWALAVKMFGFANVDVFYAVESFVVMFGPGIKRISGRLMVVGLLFDSLPRFVVVWPLL